MQGGKLLLSLLVKENYISKDDETNALERSADDPVQFLLDQEIINQDIIGQAIAENYKTKYFKLSNTDIRISGSDSLLSEEFVRKERIVPLDLKANIFATDHPERILALKENLVKNYHIAKAQIYYASSDDIDSIIINYKKPLSTRFSKIIQDQKRVAPEVLNEIIDDGLSFNASDIHFDPQENEIIIRFRVDGVLHEAGRIQKQYYENILNRIKILSQLRIDEHFATQDGAIRWPKGDKHIDMRVSVAPLLDGEKVTIRLLTEYIKDLSLSGLGLSEKDAKILVDSVKKPYGMVLVCGPTGSGKTTTLYALIKHINNPSLNITTIEDPVEYKISGTNQIQVNADKNITFANGLRSITRQDPDIILVGEIRDEETAEISINATLTGHLLFTTFHANDAATAIPRLLDMKVEPFLLASTIEIIIAQRLVRRICNSCRTSKQTTANAIEKEFLGWGKYFEDEVNLYYGKGCASCNNTGYRGRVAIFEFIQMSKDLKALALTNPTTSAIWELAKKQGSTSLLDDGIVKVKNGVTTLDELSRVVPIED